LTGSIPKELGSLTKLTELVLYYNQLAGAIPTELGNLTNLTDLRLSHNQLTGPIPTQLGNLTKLTTLYLDSNQLSGSIPTQLSNLINLRILGLGNNQLTGFIPIELGYLTNLEWLDLGVNQLAGSIPTQLGNLTQLQWLYLNNNQLSGSIPTELGNLTNLEWLLLGTNRLTGEFPTSITNLVNLSVFTFDCRITSNDPAVIAFIDAFVPGWQNNICKEQTLNGGFNTYPTGKKIPTNWKAVNFSTTDGKSTTVKQEGTASVRITGAGVNKTLSQTLILNGSSGDTFEFSFWVKGKSIPTAGVCRAQILFYNGATLNPIKPTINCVKGTYSFNQKSRTVTAPGDYTKIVVRFTYSKASGRVWLDAVSLTK